MTETDEPIKEEALSEDQTLEMKQFEEDFKRMWIKTHTPIIKRIDPPGRNEICPYCNSGLKFKKCECYKHYGEAVYEYDFARCKKIQ